MEKVFSKDSRVNNSLRHSIKDGAFYSLMSGSGESYFSAYALYFHATTAQVGLLATLPVLLASGMQLFSAWLGRRIQHRKRIILVGAAIQAFALVPLAILPWLYVDYAFYFLIATAIVYFSGSNLASPQWSSMMGDLVPERRRGRFFARRTRLCSISGFIALVVAGLFLDLFNRGGYTKAGYISIFLFAALARLISIYHLWRMYDPPLPQSRREVHTERNLWQRLRGSPFVHFSLYFSLMQFAVAIASPYFVVYMLKDLQFSYLEYTVSTATSVLVQFLALNRWGRISDIFGNRLILVVTGFLIPCLPLLWLFSSFYFYILLLQAFSGLIWAGFTLSAGNYLYDLVEPGKRTLYLAAHNVLTGLAVFAGAMVGAYLSSHLPQETVISGHSIAWGSVFMGVFLASGLVRFGVALVFLPRLREWRAVKSLGVGELFFRVSRFHPLSGLVFDTIVGRRKRA